MKLAVHQPYFFPYLGYFQLIHAVDVFVFFDDVRFTQPPLVNCNRLLVAGVPAPFTVPLERASSSALINERRVSTRHLPAWRRKLLRTLQQSYAWSPQLDDVVDVVEESLAAAPDGLAALAQRSVDLCCEYLGVGTLRRVSSSDFASSGATGVARVIEICGAAGATHYVNAPGGRDLYRPETFRAADLTLSFLEPGFERYERPAHDFVPGLSILDVLLCTSREQAQAAITNYRIDGAGRPGA